MSNIEQDSEIEQAAERIAGILIGAPKQRKGFDSYAHPDTKERAEKGLLAAKPVEEATIRKSRIVQTPTDKESLSVGIELPPLPTAMKTCTQCGEDFEPYKNGCMEPKICRKCVNAKIQKGMLKHHGRQVSEKPMEEKQEQAPTLTLVFSGKNDARIYEAVCTSAEADRRTPENQIIHFLEMALNGFPSDVTFALEETINREENQKETRG